MRTSLSFLLVSAVLLTACGSDNQAEEVIVGVPVKTMTVDQIIGRAFSVTGEVQAQKSANLTASFKANVVDIKVKPGDEVRKGQELIVLFDAGVVANANTAASNYAVASQNLTQSLQSAEKNIETSRLAVETAQTQLANTLAQNDARRLRAKEQFDDASSTLGFSVATQETNLQNAVRSAKSSVQTSLTAIDEVLEYSQARQDQDNIRETHIGVLNPSQKLQASDALNEALRAFQGDLNTYDSVRAMLEEAERAASLTVGVLGNSITSAQYPKTSLDADVASINGALGTIRSAISSIDLAKRNLDSAQQTEGNGAQSQALQRAQAEYDATIADLDAAESEARKALESAKIAYENAQVSAELTRLSARSNVTAASGDFQQARIEKDKLVITSSFSGTVVNVPVVQGQEIQAGDLLISLENDDRLKVITYLASNEVQNIALQDTVEVDGEQARITAVAPSADPITKKYKVEIEHNSANLRPGEFVRVTFETRTAPGEVRKILIPVTAIHIIGDETFVWTVDDSGDYPVTVKTVVTVAGIEGDLVHISDGLDRRDAVIIEGGRIIREEGTPIDIDGVTDYVLSTDE